MASPSSGTSTATRLTSSSRCPAMSRLTISCLEALSSNAARSRRAAWVWGRRTKRGVRCSVIVISRYQAAPQVVDVPRAEDEHQVALAEQAAQGSLGVVEARQPEDRPAVPGVGRGLGDQPAADAGEVLGPLARGIDLEDGGDVGRGK